MHPWGMMLTTVQQHAGASGAHPASAALPVDERVSALEALVTDLVGQPIR